MRKLLVSSLVVAAVAFAAQAKLSNDKCPTDKQSPIVFIPGLYSSVLNGHLTGIPENVTLPHPSCKRKT